MSKCQWLHFTSSWWYELHFQIRPLARDVFVIIQQKKYKKSFQELAFWMAYLVFVSVTFKSDSPFKVFKRRSLWQKACFHSTTPIIFPIASSFSIDDDFMRVGWFWFCLELKLNTKWYAFRFFRVVGKFYYYSRPPLWCWCSCWFQVIFCVVYNKWYLSQISIHTTVVYDKGVRILI